MKLTQGALGMLVQRYRAVLKKCRVLNLLGGTLLGVALLGGTALAAGPVTIDTTQQVADGVAQEYTTIDVENGGTLNIARQGKVTGTTVTVKAGGALHSAKNLHIGTPGVDNPGIGLLATDTLVIDGGTVTGSHLGFLSAGAALEVKNGGSLTGLETLNLKQGQISLRGGSGPDAIRALSVQNLTIAHDAIIGTGSASAGKILLGEKAELRIPGMLTFTGGDVHNTVAPNSQIVVGGITLAADTNTYTFTGPATQKFQGVDSGTFFNGSLLEAQGGGINFNTDGYRTVKQQTGAEVKASEISTGKGRIRVAHGDWTFGKLTQVGDSLVLISEYDVDPTPARLTVTGEVASAVDGELPDPNDTAHVNSKGIIVYNNGTLAVKYGEVLEGTDDTPTLKSTVKKILVWDGGTLELQDKDALTLTQLAAAKNALFATGSRGVISGITISDLADKTLQDLSAANAALPDAVVESSATPISSSVAVSSITGSAITTVDTDATLTLTGSRQDFSKEKGIALDAGTLKLGTADSTGRALNGDITMQGTGTNNVIVEGKNHTIKGDITTAGTSTNVITVQDGSHTVTGGIDASTATDTTINVHNGATLAVNGGVKGAGHTTINVGDANSKGTLVASGIQMNGGRIDFDPPFVAAGDTSNASLGGLTFASSTVDALMTVGQNSMVSLGSTDAGWLRNEVANYQNLGHGLWGKDVTAALALRAPQTLDAAGGINVDGTWVSGGAAATANTAKFADKSLLVVDAAGVGDKVALTGDGAASALNVNGGAKLHIVGGKGGSTVHITDKFNGGAATAPTSWTGKNLTTSTALLSATGGTFGAADGKYSVTLKANAASDMFPKMSDEMSGLVGAVVTQTGIDPASDNAGVRLVSRAVSDNYIGRQDRDKAAATIEGAAQIAPVGAVQASTMNVANVASGAALNRTSLALPRTDSHRTVALHQDADGVSLSGMSAGDGMKNGLGLWLMPLYQTSHVWGMESGDFEGGYHSSLGGIALGADYTVNDMFRFGAAFNIGAGYAKSSGDFNGTDNRFNFWGVSLYGGWVYNNFGLTADVGYTSNYNKLQQDLPASMQMRDLKADVTSHAWNTGLKAEYKFNAGALDIIPHVGVRYLGLVTDKHDVTSGGDTVFDVDRSVQSIWTFPLGLTFAANLESANGWTFKPQLDLGIIPATGDVKARSKVRIPGVDGSAEMKMQVVDYLTFDGGAGFELTKGDFSVGLNYNLQASEHRTGHGVFGTLRYEF